MIGSTHWTTTFAGIYTMEARSKIHPKKFRLPVKNPSRRPYRGPGVTEAQWYLQQHKLARATTLALMLTHTPPLDGIEDASSAIEAPINA